MKWIAALIVSIQMLVWPGAALAQGGYGNRTVSTVSWVEEWDPAQGHWVRVDTPVDEVVVEAAPAHVESMVERTPRGSVTTYTYEAQSYQAARYAFPAPGHAHAVRNTPHAIAHYGPFMVLDSGRAALMGSTDSASVRQFDAMLRDFPGLSVLEMIEAPGTSNDLANLAVGRRIREVGLATHVPRGGSVRSGAVELFLAGAQRSMEHGAQFAVHSWLDTYGRQPGDFAPDGPENRLYLDYYVEMGMSEDRARGFYAMTNSVPHAGARWLDAEEMQRWIEDHERLPQHGTQREASRTPRTFDRGDFVIAVAETAPHVLPEMTLEGFVSLAFAPSTMSNPTFAPQAMIGYSDVVDGQGAVTLASAPADASDAFLDS